MSESSDKEDVVMAFPKWKQRKGRIAIPSSTTDVNFPMEHRGGGPTCCTASGSALRAGFSASNTLA